MAASTIYQSTVKYVNSRKEAIEKNLKFYFTGKACPKGHVDLRFTSTCNCTICQHAAVVKGQRNQQMKKYGITIEKYNEMFKAQNGVCAICEQPEKVKDGKTKLIRPLCVDHCHNTNKIRGLLYSACNMGIGNLNHDVKLLNKAAIYCSD
jgi:hypothetical protein